MTTPKTPEEIVNMVSVQLREFVHDINNALFISKGFLEEVNEEVQDKHYIQPKFDHENFSDMLNAISRNIEKIDHNLIKLRKYAKEDIFTLSGIDKPS